VKVAFDLDSQRVAGFYEIFEDDVNGVLVKYLYVAE
jgi:hypothetical protein